MTWQDIAPQQAGTDPDRTAGLVINVLPAGEPGKVFITIQNTGPEPLSRQETASVLRSALRIVERGTGE